MGWDALSSLEDFEMSDPSETPLNGVLNCLHTLNKIFKQFFSTPSYQLSNEKQNMVFNPSGEVFHPSNLSSGASFVPSRIPFLHDH